MTARRPRQHATWPWKAVGVLGEIVATVGLVLLLLLVYQLFWSNVRSSWATDAASDQLEQQWSDPQSSSPAESTVPPSMGEPFGRVYIKRLRASVWGTPLLEGVSASALAKGVGHYPDSALPGEVGNFAIAGHRATNGEPLRDIDRLRAGDRVLVETRTTWFVYELREDRIVRPDETWVIDPAPGKADAKPTERLITLTTCNPRWASTERWVWWGELLEVRAKDAGTSPVEIDGSP